MKIARPRRRIILRRFAGTLSSIVILGLLSVAVSETAIRSAAAGRCYESVADIPTNEVGLVLGTSKYAGRRRLNRYYTARIEAAAALWRVGKVRKLLVSGDNRRVDYNEPKVMQADLIAAGVPKSAIACDYAGIRTLDSMARAKIIFGQGKITVISQKFHNERAIYLGQHWGIDAVGLDAECPPLKPKLQIRETLARLAAVWDSAVGTKPRHLGEKITI